MALCSICGTDASVILSRRPEGGDTPAVAHAFCTPCWTREGQTMAALLTPPEWQLDVRDPELTGIPPERIEYFLSLERFAALADLGALAVGFLQYSRETGRPLPPELRAFAGRYARSST